MLACRHEAGMTEEGGTVTSPNVPRTTEWSDKTCGNGFCLSIRKLRRDSMHRWLGRGVVTSGEQLLQKAQSPYACVFDRLMNCRRTQSRNRKPCREGEIASDTPIGERRCCEQQSHQLQDHGSRSSLLPALRFSKQAKRLRDRLDSYCNWRD